MDELPDELFDLICFNLTCITDVRCLSMVCKKYNLKCQTQIIDMEMFYKKKYKGIDLIKYLDKYSIEKFTIEIVLDNYCNLLTDKYYTENNEVICSVLALCGKFELLKYANSKSCQIINYATSCAAYNGHVDILDWIFKNTNFEINYVYVCSNASRNGHVNVLEWLNQNSLHISTETCERDSINNGHINILQWLLQHNLMVETKISSYAACYGKVNILQWARDNKLIQNNSFCSFAASNNHINVLQWAKDNKYSMEDINYLSIIQSGHIDVITWLYNNGYTINDNICGMAIKYGHIDILQWAINHNYKCDNLVNFAIECNSINILQWTLRNNYKIDENIYENAVLAYNYDIIKWTIKNNLPTKPMSINVTVNNHDTIHLLLKHNLLIVDVDNCMGLLTINKNTIQLIGSKYFKIKKQYHIIIKNNTIKHEKYGEKNDCNNQKIVCYDSDGNIDICDCNCNHDCWWYFMMYCLNENHDIKSLAREKIYDCDKHKKYLIIK